MNLKQAHQLNWSFNDNPNGWIEPTSFCNLACPGCYRGCDKESHLPENYDLNEMYRQIDWMMDNRNIQTLSVAGGEPLLYPHIVDIVQYASGKKLNVMLYTNGLKLSEGMLLSLKKAGVTQVVIHIDEFQDRLKDNSTDKLIELRNQYCALFRKVKGVGLGFIQPLTPASLKNTDKLNRFFKHNRDIISLVVYTLYQEIVWDHSKKPSIDTNLNMHSAIQFFEENGYFRPATYLLSTKTPTEPSWVFSYSVGTHNKVLGYLNKKACSFIHKRYRKKKGRYMFTSRKNTVNRKGLLKLSFIPSVFAVLLKSLFMLKPLYFQTYLVLRGPVQKGQSWDLCVSCPDAMLYKGKLVPSCILEEIKKKKTFQEKSIEKY